MSKINTFSNYYKTNNSWLPILPQNWSVDRFNDLINLKHGYQFRDYDFTDEGIKIIKITQLSSEGYLELDNCSFIDINRLKEFRKIIIYDGDVLMALTGGTIGKIIRTTNINEPLLQNYRVGSFIPNKKRLDKGYMFYFLSSSNLFDQINFYINRNGQPNVGKENFKYMYIGFPPVEEQTQIAKYLDAKTQAIDKKINLLTTKIEYYKELRKTIINNAVTKGLDKNVKLKESELSFEIPVHWKSYRLKNIGYLYSGLSGKAGDDFNQDDNPNNKNFIPFTNIANNTNLKKDHLGTVIVYENEKQNKVRKGDIFFLMSSEGYDDIGKTAVLKEDIKETYLNSFCKGYRLTKSFCFPNFVNYLLLSANYRNLLITEGKGFTRINLKMEKITDFIVYLPPTKKEQIEIATYLDAKTSIIDKIITNIQTQIETLKELRKTLINDVVTGKVKVN